MKVLFFISVNGHGSGGHFHSLNHISRKIAEQNTVKIISIGPGNSKIIRSNPHFHGHINFSGYNFLHLKREIAKLKIDFNPDIYHCFDEGSYNTIRLIVSSKKNKVFVNKCGGPNPVRYPNVTNLILFSFENLYWFEKQNKYLNSKIFFIPNRVRALLPDIPFHKIVRNPNDFIFMRVCRIGSTYKKSILNSIELIERLLLENICNVRLYIIGVVEDCNLYEELKRHPLVASCHIIFFIESNYTSEAAKLLHLADAVIGTGRGLMEAASLAMPLLALNKDGNMPVLLNKDNFFDAFKTNFSERNVFSNFSPDENIRKIKDLVQKESYYDEMSAFSKEVFNKYFDLDKVAQDYSDAYSAAILGGNKILYDFPLIILNFVKFFCSSLKIKSK